MRRITLVELGAGPLPAQTPAAVRYAAWFPQVYAPPLPPALSGLTATPVVDGVLLEWSPAAQSGVLFVVEIGDAEDGPWTELARVEAPRYLFSGADTAARWFSVTPSVRGQLGTAAKIQAAPKAIASEQDLVELQLELEAVRVEMFEGDARTAREAADALLAETLAQAAALEAERIAREAEVSAARKRIDAIDDDEILSPVEKPALIIEYRRLKDELPGLLQQAALSEVVEEADALVAALADLDTYLAGQTNRVPWDDTSDITYLT